MPPLEMVLGVSVQLPSWISTGDEERKKGPLVVSLGPPFL